MKLLITILIFAACYNCAQINAPTNAGTFSERGQFTQQLRRSEPTWKLYHNPSYFHAQDAHGDYLAPWNSLRAMGMEGSGNTAEIVTFQAQPVLTRDGSKRESASSVKARASRMDYAATSAQMIITNAVEQGETSGWHKAVVRSVAPKILCQINKLASDVQMSGAQAKLTRGLDVSVEGCVRFVVRDPRWTANGTAAIVPMRRTKNTRRFEMQPLTLTVASALAAARPIGVFSASTTSRIMGVSNGGRIRCGSGGKLSGSGFPLSINFSVTTVTLERDYTEPVLTLGPTPRPPLKNSLHSGVEPRAAKEG